MAHPAGVVDEHPRGRAIDHAVLPGQNHVGVGQRVRAADVGRLQPQQLPPLLQQNERVQLAKAGEAAQTADGELRRAKAVEEGRQGARCV